MTTPTWWRPTCTQSPCAPGSFPSSSSPTSLRCGCSRRSASASLPTKSSSLPAGDREADARLERVDLVVELVAREHEARLDPQHVERLQPERRQPVRLARRHHRVPQLGRILRMTEELVPELARVPGARGDQRQALRPTEPRDREPEPLQLGERRLRRRGPDERREQLAALRALDGDVVQLVGRLLDPYAQLEPVRLLAEPDAVVRRAADEPEVRRVQPEDRAVVDHPARVVAERRVDDLAVGEPPDVARHRRLQELLRVGPENLPLAKRREIHDRRLLAAGPVLRHRAEVVVGGRQPVAVVLGDPRRQLGGSRVERRPLRQLRLGVGRHAVRDPRREPLLRRIDANLHLGRVPGVRRVDVVGAGAREADEVGQRAQQHVVARARPRLVADEQVLAGRTPC